MRAWAGRLLELTVDFFAGEFQLVGDDGVERRYDWHLPL